MGCLRYSLFEKIKKGLNTRGADIVLSNDFCKRWNERASNATYEERKQILNEFEKELQRLAKEFVESKRK